MLYQTELPRRLKVVVDLCLITLQMYKREIIIWLLINTSLSKPSFVWIIKTHIDKISFIITKKNMSLFFTPSKNIIIVNVFFFFLIITNFSLKKCYDLNQLKLLFFTILTSLSKTRKLYSHYFFYRYQEKYSFFNILLKQHSYGTNL